MYTYTEYINCDNKNNIANNRIEVGECELVLTHGMLLLRVYYTKMNRGGCTRGSLFPGPLMTNQACS